MVENFILTFMTVSVLLGTLAFGTIEIYFLEQSISNAFKEKTRWAAVLSVIVTAATAAYLTTSLTASKTKKIKEEIVKYNLVEEYATCLREKGAEKFIREKWCTEKIENEHLITLRMLESPKQQEEQ